MAVLTEIEVELWPEGVHTTFVPDQLGPQDSGWLDIFLHLS